ncbi:MAG: Mrp/NBP35 family ATP-binding protein [Oscillospiraceae bacterium]|nr:Mrp/NBP35 family ATP-binding protein [Oscillospiraceae bacterium]
MEQGCDCGGDCGDCGGDCGSCGGSCGSMDMHAPLNAQSKVKKVIGIVSGKGGVGKSLVTSLSAAMMNRRGNSVGILDADMTGPSIPMCFGVHERAKANAFGIIPAESTGGVKLISVNLFLDDETQPVVWRGSIIANTVKQFWTDVVWGDVDYMFVDMPPGTGDVPLTIFQSLPVDGIIVVTSPQDLVSMIVAKAVNMAKMMDIPILGLGENMSYFRCPDCGKEHKIYGESNIDAVAAEQGLKVLAKLPIMPDVAAACDAGEIEKIDLPELRELGDVLSAL